MDPKQLEIMREIIMKAKQKEENLKRMQEIKEYENSVKIEKNEKKIQ